MRPTEFTDAEIIEAGLTLQGEGRNVTGFALRKKVGGGTPARLRQVWEEHLAAGRPTAEPVRALPPEVAEEFAKVSAELTERISQLAAELNDKAVKTAERRASEVVREAGEQRQQAERELADASTTVDELEESLALAKEESDRLRAELDERIVQCQAQEIELAKVGQQLDDERRRANALAGDLEAAKASVLDLATLQGRLAAVTEQNDQLLTRLEGNGNAH